MRYWKDNDHWMIRDGDPDPDRDPDEGGCWSCGYLDDESADVARTDLIYVAPVRGEEGAWFCMECG